MKKLDLPVSGKTVVLFVGLVVLLLGFVGPCRKEEAHPDPQLVRVSREAIELAREAQSRNDVAYLAPGRNRVLAVAIGTVVPVAGAVAMVIFAYRSRSTDKRHNSRKGEPAHEPES